MAKGVYQGDRADGAGPGALMDERRAGIRRLRVHPGQSAELAFNMAGILALENYDWEHRTGPAHLGQSVERFDLKAALYDHLGETEGGHPETLKYDAAAIHRVLAEPSYAKEGGRRAAPFLFALRNESLAAALDQLVARRASSVLERLGHADEIKALMMRIVPEMLTRIRNLQAQATERYQKLDDAYAADGARPEVMAESKTTQGVSENYKVTTEGSVTSRNVGLVNAAFPTPLNADRITTEVTDPSTKVQEHRSERTIGVTYQRADGGAWAEVTQPTFETQTTSSTMRTAGTQTATTPNQALLHPRLDNRIAHEQLQAGLLSEELNQEITALRVGATDRMIELELEAFDLEVRKLQVNYAHTYLTSPIAGVITAIYKELGESVQAGEPVVRVEQDDVVFVVGQIVYRGPLRIGQGVTLHTTDLFEDRTPLDVPGMIRSVRGHEADNDEWEVVIECENPVRDSQKVLPLYYQFDRDNSWVRID